MPQSLVEPDILEYAEAKAFPTIGIILLGGISDKTSRLPMHTSAGISYEGVEEKILVSTRVMLNRGEPFGTLNGDRLRYSETGRSPFVILNRYKGKIVGHLKRENDNEGLSLSFVSENFGVLSGSSDAGAAAMGKNIEDMSGGIGDMVSFENELRSISESVGRSLYGGLTVTWADGKVCRTERLLGPEKFRDYAIIGCRFSAVRKPSDRIHENVVRSSRYSKRIENTLAKGKLLSKLAEDGDIKGIFEIAHQDTEEYHALSESVGVRIITPEMRALMDRINELRKESWATYIVTGGSNVFVVAEKKNASSYIERFKDYCDGITPLKVAGGAEIISKSYP